MANRIDDIYKILIDYIQADNKDKQEIKTTLQRVEDQTTKTNGRVTKLEKDFDNARSSITGLENKDNKQVIIVQAKKRLVAGVVTAVIAFWAVASVFLAAWLEAFFGSHIHK